MSNQKKTSESCRVQKIVQKIQGYDHESREEEKEGRSKFFFAASYVLKNLEVTFFAAHFFSILARKKDPDLLRLLLRLSRLPLLKDKVTLKTNSHGRGSERGRIELAFCVLRGTKAFFIDSTQAHIELEFKVSQLEIQTKVCCTNILLRDKDILI